jgi:hypothetical protein
MAMASRRASSRPAKPSADNSHNTRNENQMIVSVDCEKVLKIRSSEEILPWLTSFLESPSPSPSRPTRRLGFA